MGCFREKSILSHVSGWGGKGCLGNGCSDSREMYGLPVGASEEGELHLVMDANVSKPIHDFYLYFYFFFFNNLVKRHCPGMVTSGGNVTHKDFTEMRRMALDQNPFLLAMPQRATTMAW